MVSSHPVRVGARVPVFSNDCFELGPMITIETRSTGAALEKSIDCIELGRAAPAYLPRYFWDSVRKKTV